MNNHVQLYNNTSLDALSTSNGYVKALLTTAPMRELTKKDAKKFISDCIGAATFIGGWNKKEDSELILLVNTLMPDIDKRFRTLTQAEVRRAFENGAKGHYGETIGVSVLGCLKWLTAYYLDSERHKAKQDIETLRTSIEKKIPGRQEKRQAIQMAYAKFVTRGSFHDYGNYIYNCLDSEELITFSNQQKNEFLEQGRKMLYDRLQFAKDLQERRENDRKLESLISNNKLAVIEAKNLALKEFFKRLIAAGYKEVIFKDNGL